jgi:glycosyltransferase involved in cell wall biosynthesis
MRILKIFDGDYPWDVRVEKIADSLIDAGHDVRMLCRNRAGLPRSTQQPGGLRIVRLPALPAPLTFPWFLNPTWVACASKEIGEFRPDRILVRDLPLAPLAVWLGLRAGIPVIADLAEPYPESLRSRLEYEQLPWISRLVRNPRAAELVERWVLQRITRALVVCPEAGERLERQGLPPGRWVEVGNTPRLDRFVAAGSPPPELDGLNGQVVLLFSGLLAGDRGLEVAVDALAGIEQRTPGRCALLIVGEGPMRRPLAAQAQARGIGSRVRLTGWVDHSRLPDLITRSDIGLLPFHTCGHINATLANKLFDYMAHALPVVAADAPPMVRVLQETRAGAIFRSGDVADLARVIEGLADRPDLRKQMGSAGAAAVRARYNWNADAERLIAALEKP